MTKNYDEELYYENRCLQTDTGNLLFGPNGDRLNVDRLNYGPGYVGLIDFIHKMNISELFTVVPSIPVDFSQGDSTWYRDKMVQQYEDDVLNFTELKTIVAEDVALAQMTFINQAPVPLTLTFRALPVGFQQTILNAATYQVQLVSDEPTRFGFSLGLVSGWNQAEDSITLAPGEKVEVLGAATIGNLDQENLPALQEKVNRYLTAKETVTELMTAAVLSHEKFYQQTPKFTSSDARMDACWQYRWYILKNSLCHPRYGAFPGAVMYEGRDRRKKGQPMKPGGWEFSKLIPLSTPLQLADFRWFQDHETVKEVIRSAFAGADEDGLLISCYVNGPTRKSYANYMLWAIWQDYVLHPDPEFIKELLPAMKKYIAGHEKVYMNDLDSLLIETQHSLTGKEYQPSYWYFTEYPKDPKADKTLVTPLKRVDRSIYHYLNLVGLAAMMKAIGDKDSELYQDKAATLAGEINDKMWDAASEYYYDLHFETEEKALVKNIVGIYPYWAGIADDYQGGMEVLTNPDLFATGSGFASAAKDSPVFAPEGGWRGTFFKGRNSCVWDGPSWPYTTGIALDALGKESQKHQHRYDAEFDRYFQEYTIEHFRDGNRHRPYLVEHYNPITGERLSDEADYNHSFWLDLVMSFVAGLQIELDHVVVDPIKTHLNWFKLEDAIIRDHHVAVEYANEKAPTDLGLKIGLTVKVDGVEVAYSEELQLLRIDL